MSGGLLSSEQFRRVVRLKLRVPACNVSDKELATVFQMWRGGRLDPHGTCLGLACHYSQSVETHQVGLRGRRRSAFEQPGLKEKLSKPNKSGFWRALTHAWVTVCHAPMPVLALITSCQRCRSTKAALSCSTCMIGARLLQVIWWISFWQIRRADQPPQTRSRSLHPGPAWFPQSFTQDLSHGIPARRTMAVPTQK